MSLFLKIKVVIFIFSTFFLSFHLYPLFATITLQDKATLRSVDTIYKRNQSLPELITFHVKNLEEIQEICQIYFKNTSFHDFSYLFEKNFYFHNSSLFCQIDNPQIYSVLAFPHQNNAFIAPALNMEIDSFVFNHLLQNKYGTLEHILEKVGHYFDKIFIFKKFIPNLPSQSLPLLQEIEIECYQETEMPAKINEWLLNHSLITHPLQINKNCYNFNKDENINLPYFPLPFQNYYTLYFTSNLRYYGKEGVNFNDLLFYEPHTTPIYAFIWKLKKKEWKKIILPKSTNPETTIKNYAKTNLKNYWFRCRYSPFNIEYETNTCIYDIYCQYDYQKPKKLDDIF